MLSLKVAVGAPLGVKTSAILLGYASCGSIRVISIIVVPRVIILKIMLI
jgi:hypothetical protein